MAEEKKNEMPKTMVVESKVLMRWTATFALLALGGRSDNIAKAFHEASQDLFGEVSKSVMNQAQAQTQIDGLPTLKNPEIKK